MSCWSGYFPCTPLYATVQGTDQQSLCMPLYHYFKKLNLFQNLQYNMFFDFHIYCDVCYNSINIMYIYNLTEECNRSFFYFYCWRMLLEEKTRDHFKSKLFLSFSFPYLHNLPITEKENKLLLIYWGEMLNVNCEAVTMGGRGLCVPDFSL